MADMVRSQTWWRKVGLASAALVVALLLVEHFIGHGRDLNPVHHWLSEYVLSDSAQAVWLMRAAFAGLAIAALSVGCLSNETGVKVLFFVASIALGSMIFFDSEPNDGRRFQMHWPPTPGNLHQLALYVAIGATILGMAVRVLVYDRPPVSTRHSLRSKVGVALLLVALVAIGAQVALVAYAESAGQMTRFAGITERAIVLAALTWVAMFCSAPSSPRPREP